MSQNRSSKNSTMEPELAKLSVEGQAQRQDAATLAQSDIESALNIYRLVPIAAKGDRNWDNASDLGEVVVAARSTGDARIVAAAAELDFMEIDASPAEGVTTAMASAFRNEKLYSVIELERGRTGLSRGVITGEVPLDTIRPTQV